MKSALKAVEAEFYSFADAALDCTSRERFRDLVLKRLQALVPFDAGLFLSCAPTPDLPSQVGWDPVLITRLTQRRRRYVAELLKLCDGARAQGGVALDRTVLSRAERQRLSFFKELAKPQGLTVFLCAPLGLRGATTAMLLLARRGMIATFTGDERLTVTGLLPVIALGDSAHARTRTPRGRTWPSGSPEASFLATCAQLTDREREIVAYVALGMRNEQIAAACGSSTHTVKNQMRSIFQKIGLSSRTELAYAALRTGFVA